MALSPRPSRRPRLRLRLRLRRQFAWLALLAASAPFLPSPSPPSVAYGQQQPRPEDLYDSTPDNTGGVEDFYDATPDAPDAATTDTAAATDATTTTTTTATTAADDSGTAAYGNCDPEDYYAILITQYGADPLQWPREDVVSLITQTHRTVLPIQSPGNDDVYTALIDLWPGDVPDETVHLAYRNISYPSTPYANSQSWSRGNLWPKDRRAAFPQAESESDIHLNVPADTTVFAYKGDLMFGDCGTVQAAELCQPLPEAAQTFTDGKVWRPPPGQTQAEQARSILYAALRYGGVVSDCPPFDAADTIAYRTPLLEWHAAADPDEEEVARNQRICERWQGNRNPFVDYPQLAEAYFGTPDQIRDGYRAYDQCFNPDTGLIDTMAPTAAPNDCADVRAGNIQLILENSEDPDQMAFFTLDQIKQAVDTIYVTDKPWNGTHFLDATGEGTVQFLIPPETTQQDGQVYNGLAPGYVYAYGFDKTFVNWTNATDGGTGVFDLDPSGDTILTYCIDADDNPHFIHAFTTAEGGFAEPGLSAEEYGTSRSALPANLNASGVGFVAVPTFANYIYNGTISATYRNLLALYADPNNYVGSDDIRFDIEELANPSGAARSIHLMTGGMMAWGVLALVSTWVLFL